MRKVRDHMGAAAFAVAAAAFAVSGTARAGSITGVTAPPTAVAGHPVTITIQGRGPCSTVNVNYNTGLTTVMTYSAASFPFSPPAHTYAGTGPKTILVTATGNCTGRATTTINVTAAAPPPPPPASGLAVPTALSALCARVTCGPNLARIARPLLNDATPASVQPGQRLMITGSFLGATPGTVRMRLPGYPGAPAILANWTPFQVTHWTPLSIEGTIEAGLSGFLDGDAQIVVQRSDDVLSNAITVHFVADREVVPVPRELVTVSACGDDAVSRNCLGMNDIQGTRYDWSLFGAASDPPALPSNPSASFSGFHQNYWDDGGCTGMDQYDLRLPPGWVIQSFTPGVRSTFHATFRVSAPLSGRRVGSVIVDWGLTGGDAHIFYEGWFFAEGPRGVPMTL